MEPQSTRHKQSSSLFHFLMISPTCLPFYQVVFHTCEVSRIGRENTVCLPPFLLCFRISIFPQISRNLAASPTNSSEWDAKRDENSGNILVHIQIFDTGMSTYME